MRSVLVKIGILALVQLALVGMAVAPRLSARLTGDEYRLAVEPVDPIDPFRGAYVDLAYPDLALDDEHAQALEGEGTVYVTLVRYHDVWRAGSYTRERPSGTPYLTCNDRDWRLRCGIESLFLAQDEAAGLQQDLTSGAVAVVRVDRWGHAALVRVEDA